MAFRHYGGTPAPVRVAWRCPTCGSENTGALEEGCASCRAGADAAKSSDPRRGPGPPTTESLLQSMTGGPQELLGLLPPNVVPVVLAFRAWVKAEIPLDHIADPAQLQKAFIAGAAWAREQQAAPAGTGTLTSSEGGNERTLAAAQGSWVFMLAHLETQEEIPVDHRTHFTILAALAFYRDNQLAYGAVPGQLDAQECSALIDKLTPQAEEIPK